MTEGPTDLQKYCEAFGAPLAPEEIGLLERMRDVVPDPENRVLILATMFFGAVDSQWIDFLKELGATIGMSTKSELRATFASNIIGRSMLAILGASRNAFVWLDDQLQSELGEFIDRIDFTKDQLVYRVDYGDGNIAEFVGPDVVRHAKQTVFGFMFDQAERNLDPTRQLDI